MALTLRQRVLRAGSWSFAGHAAGQGLRIASNLIMTRLLVPEMFGVMAIATIVMMILNMLSDLGVRQNIIQSPRGDDPAFLDTAWVVQIVRGMLLWLVALLFSGGLHFANVGGLIPPHSAYAAAELPMVVAVNAFAAVILGFQSTNVAIAQRNFEQRRIVQIELAGQVIGLALMIPMAVATRSIWALVAGGLVASLASTMLGHLWLGRRRNRFAWDGSALRELIGFGKWAFVSSLFTVLALNGDRLMLGALVDPEVLGLFAIAALIVGAVEGALGRLFSAISLPALSEIARSEPARLREVYYRLRVPGDTVLLFAAGALFMAGELVINLLYDPRYAAAGPMLQVLSLSLITARYGVAYQIYLAVGVPRYMALIQIVRCAALFSLVPLLYATGGFEAALWGIALHGLAMVPFVHVFNARLGLNDWRRELMVLAAVPLGLLCGGAAHLLVAAAR
jgi:O-antigen/teichoic acid export membrane protein